MRGKSLIIQTNRHLPRWQLFLAAGLSLITVIVSLTLYNSVNAEEQGRVLLSVYDDGVKTSFTTDQTTVESALAQRGITVHQQDRIEPALNEELSATHYSINIYRSRPILIEDGVIRERIMSSGQTASAIASDAGLHIYDEDITLIKNSSNTAEDGVATSLVVSRAKLITVDFFGKITEFRTQANTVGEFLQEKSIVLAENDGMSLSTNSPITEGSEFRIWRNGKQTITVDEEIEFEVEKIHDADKLVGYREVKTPGEQGKKTVTYEISIKNGEEVSRQEINSVTTLEPKKQVEVIGVKSTGKGLTRSMGVNHFTDSNGVSHRETYYDLPMNIVMRNCNAGGIYTVREDGVKIDQNGYVIVAANLNNYPRCSTVETSLGVGKVYDTGGFAFTHTHGFDIATDWTNYDGV